MRIHAAGFTFSISLGTVLLTTAFAVLATLYCARLKRAGRQAKDVANQRIWETDDITNQLLQGVQGLLLTLHVVAQKLDKDHASRQLMEHALSEGDELVSVGRRRFEQVAFQTEDEAKTEQRGGQVHSAKNSYLKLPDGRDDRL